MGQIGRLHRPGDRRPRHRLAQFMRNGAGRDQKHRPADRGRLRSSHCLFPALTLSIAVSPIWAAHATAQIPSPLAGVPSPPDNPLPAGPAVSISLTDAVALALRDNRTIRSAYLQRVAQKFDLVVAENRFRPKLDIAADIFADHTGGGATIDSSIAPTLVWLAPTGGSLQFSWERRDQLSGGPTGSSDIASLSLVQPLLRGGGLAVNMAPIRIARLQEAINRLALKQTVSTIVTNVIFAYRSLLEAQEQERLAKVSLDRAQHLLGTNRSLIEAGRMAAADIVQTQSDVANQEVFVLQAAQQKRSAQLALLLLLAVDPRTNIVAGDPITVQHADIDTDRLVALGLATRMDILAQRKALEQNRQAVLVARNDRLWDLSIVGNVSRIRGNGVLVRSADNRTDSSIALQLNIPIGGPEQRQGEIQTTTNLRVAEVRYEDLCQSAETQIRDARQSVEANWQQLETARRARSLAQRALDIEREKLAAGRASNFEVLSFQADLRAADTQQLTASIAYLNALTALDEQVGSTLDTWKIELND